jgi:hypothetical protein
MLKHNTSTLRLYFYNLQNTHIPSLFADERLSITFTFVEKTPWQQWGQQQSIWSLATYLTMSDIVKKEKGNDHWPTTEKNKSLPFCFRSSPNDMIGAIEPLQEVVHICWIPRNSYKVCHFHFQRTLRHFWCHQ